MDVQIFTIDYIGIKLKNCSRKMISW